MTHSTSTCSAPSCDRAVKTRGLCNAHDQQRRRGKPLTHINPRRLSHEPVPTCAYHGCGRPAVAKGLCQCHRVQQKRDLPLSTLRPDRPPVPKKAPKKKPSRAELFWSKVTKTESCWLWNGSTTKNGYGQFGIGWPKSIGSHRWAYEDAYGPIPKGMQIDHICRVRLCVNPTHLRLATNKQNHENIVAHRKNKTGIRGVYYDTRRDRYYVQVTHHGKRYFGNTHKTLESAEQAAIALRNQLYTHNEADRV